MAEWAKTDPAIRKTAEEKLRAEWGRWMGEHAKLITLTEAAREDQGGHHRWHP